MMRIDYQIPLNSVEVWKLVNETMVAHPFHIHDVQFYITDRNGNPPGPEESGRKDVVLVPAGDSVLFVTKFEDFVDTVPYMYHCHILMHEDDGMMGQFVVTGPSTGIEQHETRKTLLVYPNPASTTLTIDSPELPLQGSTLNIYNSIGTLVYSAKKADPGTWQIRTAEFPAGLYTLEIKTNSTVATHKFVKE